MEKRKHIVILAAGDFPSHEIPLRTLREADFVVCCDSAYSKFSIFNSQFSIPFVVIGDGDSLSDKTKQELGDRWIHIAEQDYNDLHKAMQWATARFSIFLPGSQGDMACDHSGANFQFSILGATGRREDHTLGNTSYLATFADEYPGIDLVMLTDHGRFRAVRGTHTFDSFPRQQVSIFSMNPDNPIDSEGLRWPLDAFRPHRWWQASLNEALGNSFTLTAADWLLVFQTYDPKA